MISRRLSRLPRSELENKLKSAFTEKMKTRNVFLAVHRHYVISLHTQNQCKCHNMIYILSKVLSPVTSWFLKGASAYLQPYITSCTSIAGLVAVYRVQTQNNYIRMATLPFLCWNTSMCVWLPPVGRGRERGVLRLVQAVVHYRCTKTVFIDMHAKTLTFTGNGTSVIIVLR